MSVSQPASVATPSNTIARNRRRQRLYSVIALLLIVLAIVLVPFALLERKGESSQMKPPFRGNLSMQENEQVEVRLVWFDNAVSSVGDQYCHLARDERHNYFAIVVNREDSQALEARLESDPELAALKSEPLSLIGEIRELDPDTGGDVMVRFTRYGIGDGEPMSPLDVRANYGIFKSYASETAGKAWMFWIGAAAAGFCGLIFLLAAWNVRRRQQSRV
ncbi:MAG: hypothetical protein QM270_04460 [Bacillota bacterium]|nr:hypothetical protein [Bacillota bacterium]